MSHIYRMSEDNEPLRGEPSNVAGGGTIKLSNMKGADLRKSSQ